MMWGGDMDRILYSKSPPSYTQCGKWLIIATSHSVTKKRSRCLSFLADTKSNESALNLCFTMPVPFCFYKFCTKYITNYLLYPKLLCPYWRRNSTFGWSTTTSSNIQQMPSPWWFRLTLHRHGYGEYAYPTPGCLFGRGKARAVWLGFIYMLTGKEIN